MKLNDKDDLSMKIEPLEAFPLYGIIHDQIKFGITMILTYAYLFV
jgi:hypothetical protein